jgi:hypothetical protein
MIGRLERGGDQEDGTLVFDLSEPPSRFFPSRGRAGGDHDAMHGHSDILDISPFATIPPE